MTASSRPRVWFVSETFGSAENSTGHLLGRLAAGFEAEAEFDVGILTFAKTPDHRTSRLPDRALTALRNSIMLSGRVLKRVRRGDVIIAVTNPPFLPPMIAAAAGARGARLILIVHDLYPEVLYALNLARPGSISGNAWERAYRFVFERSAAIVTVGRDMQSLVARKIASPERVHFIPNWADDNLTPARNDGASNPHDLVVQYSGNMGSTHPVQSLLDAAQVLRDTNAAVTFQVSGWGSRFDWFTSEVTRRNLSNVRILSPIPRDRLQQRLDAADIGLVLMMRGMRGVSVPCRAYNLLAAGKPLIVMADADSELGMMVSAQRIGWVCNPESSADLATVISQAAEARISLPEMGRRAATLGHDTYSFSNAFRAYSALIRAVHSCP